MRAETPKPLAGGGGYLNQSQLSDLIARLSKSKNVEPSNNECVLQSEVDYVPFTNDNLKDRSSKLKDETESPPCSTHTQMSHISYDIN